MAHNAVAMQHNAVAMAHNAVAMAFHSFTFKNSVLEMYKA